MTGITISIVHAGDDDPEPVVRAAELFIRQHAGQLTSTWRPSSIAVHVSGNGIPAQNFRLGKVMHGCGTHLRHGSNDGWASVEEDDDGNVRVTIGGSARLHRRVQIVYVTPEDDPAPVSPEPKAPAPRFRWRGKPVAGSLRGRWEIWSSDKLGLPCEQYVSPEGIREWDASVIQDVLGKLNEAPC